MALALILSGLPLIQHASGQSENLKVLNYSWYIDNLGSFDVVGEIQNVGPSTIEPVVINGTVYDKDGNVLATSPPTQAYVQYMTPQQKAPFWMGFSTQNSLTGDLSWLPTFDHVDFKVYRADVVNAYQYPDLKIQSSSGTVDADGTYWVSGSVQNVGSKTATNVRVIGTFFNSSGTVVAVGYTDVLSPSSLDPSASTSFKVGAFDQNETAVSADRKISTYTVMVQTEEPILNGTAPSPPPSDSGSTSSDGGSSSAGGSSSDGSSPSLAPEMPYIAAGVIAIVAVALILLVVNKRRSGSTASNKSMKSQMHKKAEVKKGKKPSRSA